MTTRRLILAIAIWILTATLVFVLWRYASAQRRRVEPSLYLEFPMLAVPPPMEAANHGNVWFDPNGDFVFRDHEGNAAYFVSGSPYNEKCVICRTFTSAGVQACIDSLGDNRGEVICIGGTYSITTPITMRDYVHLTGIGQATIFERDANDIVLIDCNDVLNIKISNITFDGNKANTYVSYGTSMIKVYNSTITEFTNIIENCILKDFEGYGLHINNYWYETRVMSCKFFGGEGNTFDGDPNSLGIYLETIGPACAYIVDCDFLNLGKAIFNNHISFLINCKFTNNNYCIHADDRRINIANSIFDTNNGPAVYLSDYDEDSSTADATISNNFFFDANSPCYIRVDAGKADIQNNKFTAGSTVSDIYLKTANNTVKHNVFIGSANDNVKLESATSTVITGNSFACDGYDIEGDAGSTNTVIYGNKHDQGISYSGTYGDFSVYGGIEIDDKIAVCGTFTSAGINACIDALGTEGGIVILPEGVYTGSEQVTFDYDNITIQGSGPGTILMLSGDHHGLFAADEIDGIRIYDLTIDANSVAAASCSLIHILGSEDTIIRGVEFKNFLGDALIVYSDVSTSDYALIQNCTFGPAADDSSYAIYPYNNQAGAWGCIDISHCVFHSCDIGVRFQNRNNTSITNCKFFSCGDYAIQGSAEDSIISNCYFDSCLTKNIHLTSSHSSRVFNNTFWNSSDSEIYIASSFNIVVSDNTISESNDIATGNIYLSVVSSGSITGNTFDLDANDADYCIYVSTGGASVIANNLFDSDVDVSAIYYSNAVGNIVYGNRNLSETGTVLSKGEFDVGAIPKFRAESLSNGYLKLWPYQNDALADDGTVNLPSAVDGTIIVSITDPNSSFTDECGLFMVTNAGVVTKVSGTANTDAADTDGDLCVYDGGTYGVIKNRLGDVGILRAFYFYQ